MKSWLLILALALSVLFNVFFAAGYLRATNETEIQPSENQSVHNVAAALDLDDGQQALFAELNASQREESQAFEENLALLRVEIAALLRDGDANSEQLQPLLQREAELHRERRLARSERFHTFVESLAPAQRDKLGRTLRHGPSRDGERQRNQLKRFDLNNDGRLDETERIAAHEELERHLRERAQQRRMFMKQFDQDQNGRLDADEREAMREWMRTHRPNDPTDSGRSRNRERGRDYPDRRPPARRDGRAPSEAQAPE